MTSPSSGRATKIPRTALDGGAAKFTVPIIVNGKVYAGTKSSIVCYPGLRAGG